jgi:hypothetical protein
MHFQTIHYILYPGKFQRVISGSEDHFLPAMIVHPFDQLAPGNIQRLRSFRANKLRSLSPCGEQPTGLTLPSFAHSLTGRGFESSRFIQTKRSCLL